MTINSVDKTLFEGGGGAILDYLFQSDITDQTDVALNSTITSNEFFPGGLPTSRNISVNKGEYSLNGGAFTSAPGTWNFGDGVTLRQTSSGAGLTPTVQTVAIGAVNGLFTVTTVNVSPGLFTPIIHHTFDSGTLGTTADGPDGYGSVVYSDEGNANDTNNPKKLNEIIYSDTWANFGSQSARHFNPEGFPPPWQFQGETNFSPITDEIWYRIFVLFEAGYVFNTAGGSSKMMRLNCRYEGSNVNNSWGIGIQSASPSNGTEGYGFGMVGHPGEPMNSNFDNNLCAWDGGVPGQYPCRSWGAFGQHNLNNVLREQWYNVELNVKFATDNTGHGRMFVDKKLMWETGPMQTIKQAGDGAWEIELFSTPQPGEWGHDQYAYVDGIVITDGANPPPNVSEDAFAYPIIGDWTG